MGGRTLPDSFATPAPGGGEVPGATGGMEMRRRHPSRLPRSGAPWMRLALAVIVGTALWTWRTIANNPVVEQAFELAVGFEPVQPDARAKHEARPATVTATVRGRREQLRELRASPAGMIAAYLDVRSLTAPTGRAQVQTRSAVRNVTIMSVVPDTVSYSIREQDEKYVEVRVRVRGPGAEEAQGKAKVSPDRVKVSGPRDVVDRIVAAEVTVSAETLSNEQYVDRVARAIDENDEFVYDEGLVLAPSEVRVSIPASTVRPTFVPVEPVVVGRPAPGYAYNGKVEVSPATVQVQGPPDILRGLKSIKTQPIDITGRATDLVAAKVTLETPSSVAPVDVSQVEVTVRIEKRE